MTSWAYTAAPGGGKTLGAVDQIRDALWHGRRVATNLDLILEKMLPRKNKNASVIRLPDRPTADDLRSIGLGCDTKGDEQNYGLLVLDEMGTWLNSRQWNESGRKELLDWFRHHRKQRWHCLFIIQDLEALDKQLREAIVEYHVRMVRLDKIKIPFVSSLGTLLTLGLWNGYLPRVHMAVSYYLQLKGLRTSNERWFFRGLDLYDAYDTEQVISDDYQHGVYSYLPPWQQWGRYQPPTGWQRLKNECRQILGLDAVPRPRPCLTPTPHLAPLLRLPPDLRWQATRRLVALGKL